MNLKVATKSTDVAPDRQAVDLTTPVVRHRSGHICSKQTELKVATNTIKDEIDSKLTGKTTDTIIPAVWLDSLLVPKQ